MISFLIYFSTTPTSYPLKCFGICTGPLYDCSCGTELLDGSVGFCFHLSVTCPGCQKVWPTLIGSQQSLVKHTRYDVWTFWAKISNISLEKILGVTYLHSKFIQIKSFGERHAVFIWMLWWRVINSKYEKIGECNVFYINQFEQVLHSPQSRDATWERGGKKPHTK